MSVSILLVLCATIFVEQDAKTRAWVDPAAGRPFNAELVGVKVTLRLSNGQMRSLDLSTLSAADRQFVVDSLSNVKSEPADAASAAGRQSPESVSNLEAAVADGNEKLLAATKDISLFRTYSDSAGTYGAIRQLESHREAVRLLSEYSQKEDRVKELFASRLKLLKAAPRPEDRAKAALGLSRATSMSKEVIPALLASMKSDVSPEVRLIAALSIAGFGKEAAIATSQIVEQIDASADGKSKSIYLLALIDLDKESGPLKRIIGKCFEAYKRSRDDAGSNALNAACNILTIADVRNSTAVTQLLDAADTAAGRGEEAEFRQVSNALVRLAGDDARVVKYFERAAKEGPAQFRVYCDSIAKQLKL